MELLDIVGNRVGRLTVVEYTKSIKHQSKRGRKHFYKCLCECGNEKEVAREGLLSGSTKSCGCLHGNQAGFDPKDIVGKQFERLTITAYLESKKWSCGRSGYFYKCRCDCGNSINATRQNLLYGHTKSCGCLKKKTGVNNKDWKGTGELSGRYWSHIRKHAENRSLIFSVTILEAWKKFLDQDRKCALTGVPISLQGSKKHNYKQTASIDRIDSNKGYETGNLQWVHKTINLMKMNLPEVDFVEWCRLVYLKNGANND